MTNPKPLNIPFSCAGRHFEARAVRASTNWEIWIFENNRKLARYTLIHNQTVKDAERYNLDLIGNEMCAMIQAIKTRQLIPLGLAFALEAGIAGP